MTEADWLACTDPREMLDFIASTASDRSLRLFACACVRRIHALCWPDAKRPGIAEIVEGFADGRITRDEVKDVESRFGARGGVSSRWAVNCGGFALFNDDRLAIAKGAVDAADWFFRLFTVERIHESTGVWEQWNCSQAIASRDEGFNELAAVMRDIFGDPFNAITLSQNCCTSDIAKLAQTIYDDRAFQRLSELGETLETAGCTNADILGHCRGNGQHVRGCWVVDMVLEKS